MAIGVVKDGSERLRGDEHRRAASLLLLLEGTNAGQEPSTKPPGGELQQRHRGVRADE